MPVRSMTLTTTGRSCNNGAYVSDACQINDFDHDATVWQLSDRVSDACQINDFDHRAAVCVCDVVVSDACQINDFDHCGKHLYMVP